MVAGVVCFAVLAMPLLFLFARPGATPSDGEMSRLYSSLVGLLGEKGARFGFCAAWLALDAALTWRLFFSKDRANDSGPIEGLGD
jgi:hypothetical protein